MCTLSSFFSSKNRPKPPQGSMQTLQRRPIVPTISIVAEFQARSTSNDPRECTGTRMREFSEEARDSGHVIAIDACEPVAPQWPWLSVFSQITKSFLEPGQIFRGTKEHTSENFLPAFHRYDTTVSSGRQKPSTFAVSYNRLRRERKRERKRERERERERKREREGYRFREYRVKDLQVKFYWCFLIGSDWILFFLRFWQFQENHASDENKNIRHEDVSWFESCRIFIIFEDWKKVVGCLL